MTERMWLTSWGGSPRGRVHVLVAGPDEYGLAKTICGLEPPLGAWEWPEDFAHFDGHSAACLRCRAAKRASTNG